MRVLITTSTYPKRPGDGVPPFVHHLAEALAAKHAVTVVAPGAADLPEVEDFGSVEVRRFTYFRPARLQQLAYGHGIEFNLRRSRLVYLQAPCFFGCQLLSVRNLTRSRCFDVINSHWLIPQGLAGALIRRRSRGLKHVVTVHGGGVNRLHRLPGGRAIARFIVRHADAVIAVSSRVLDELNALLGHPCDGVVLPMGVKIPAGDVCNDEAQRKSRSLLFVGRLNRIKGVEHLLKAMVEPRVRRTDADLTIIGDGPAAQGLQEMTTELGLSDRVRFLGRQPHDVVLREISRSSTVVVPSIVDDGRTEGLPTVILEAMGHGAKVVASAVGGIPEIVQHGVNGWLVQPADSIALAVGIERSLLSEDSCRIVRRALETARSYSATEVADRYERILKGLATSG